MSTLEAILLALFLSGGIVFMVWVIGADRTRYLTKFDLHHWNDRTYLSLLPNFLQNIHDKGLSLPWPRRLNGLSASWFSFRVRTILRQRPALRKHEFVRAHLNLQALLFLLKPFIDDAVLQEQSKIAADRILSMLDCASRDQLVRFVDDVRAYRAQFLSSLTGWDGQIIMEMKHRNFLGALRSANAMFHEHGYNDIFVGLDTLRRWHTLEGSELVQELPKLGKVSSSSKKYVSSMIPFPDQE